MCPYGAHKGHDCVLLVDYMASKQEDIKKTVKELLSRVEALEKLGGEIEQEKKLLSEVLHHELVF